MKTGYIHLDGNHLNFSADNLLVVSVEELREFYKLKHEKLSQEYTKTAILSIRLKRKLEEM